MAGRWRVIAGLVPAAVATAEVFGDDPRARLLPGEEAAVARAQPARVREFATGRACARRALAALGLPEVPVPRGPRGAPGWPSGVVGAITHCPGYRAAVAARATDARALGIDAEPDAPLPPGVGRRVAPGGAGPGLGASTPTACCSAPRRASTRPGTRSRVGGWVSPTSRCAWTREGASTCAWGSRRPSWPATSWRGAGPRLAGCSSPPWCCEARGARQTPGGIDQPAARRHGLEVTP